MRALCRPGDALLGFHQHISNNYLTHALETLPRLIGKPRAFALGCQRSIGLRSRPAARRMIVKFLKQTLSLFLSCCVALATARAGLAAQSEESSAPPKEQGAQQADGQLHHLVAPIALYPDALVAQILAAATYPAQVVEAARCMQQHSAHKEKKLTE